MLQVLYQVLLLLAFPFALANLLWRGVTDRRWWQGISQRFGFVAPQSAGSVWLHAVSVGEVQAAAAIVKELRNHHPQTPLLMTCGTPTGAERARALFGDTVTVSFLPFDLLWCVRLFLRRARPRIGIVIEKEIWPNLFRVCGDRGIPLVLASAAMSRRAIGRYRLLFRLFPSTLADGLTIAAQTGGDAERFKEAGAPPERVHVIGNIKFDLELPPNIAELGARLRSQYGLGSRFVLVAGSTYEEEETVLLEAQRQLKARGHDIMMVLAPRHPPRFEPVAGRLARDGVMFLRRSESIGFLGASVPTYVEVLLIDRLGELLGFYAAADVAFVGGSLVRNVGGHNLIEPAALSVPSLTGPHFYNSSDISLALVEAGAVRIVRNVDELVAELETLVGDTLERAHRGSIGQQFVARNGGTTRRLLQLIEPVIGPPEPRSASH
ncbi:MAG: 3-deoxy-D-manno-octulosonic acid transferase [Steroidobacteraceae bacterium]